MADPIRTKENNPLVPISAKDPAEERPQSKCSEADLQNLVEKCLLQPKADVIHWQSAIGEVFPSVGDSEIVLFTSFVECGIALPTKDFIPGLLYYYRIQIHHLTPQSVLHIVVFVHFCEAFLSIEPHFELFRSLYILTPQPSAQEIRYIGCASLQLLPNVVDKYLE